MGQELTQQLTALAAFVEDSGSGPRVYLWLTCVCNTSFKISDNSSGLCEKAHSAQACGQSTHNTFLNLYKNEDKRNAKAGGQKLGILLNKPG